MADTPRNHTPIVLGVVAAVVAVIVIAVAVVASGSDDSSAPSTTTPAAGTEVTSVTAQPGGAVDPLDAAVQVTGEALPALPQGGADPAVGAVPPTLTGTDYSGAAMEIEPGAGGPKMVVFLAHWCPHCNDEIPVLLDWRDAGMIPEDLQIVGVSTGVQEAAPNFPPDEWLVEKGWDWPTLADSPASEDSAGDAADAYGLSGFPFFTIIGADGTVKLRASGEIPMDELDVLVDEALAAR